MNAAGPAKVLPLLCALCCAATGVRAFEIGSLETATPSAWIVEITGYGVLEPIYEGSKRYNSGIKPQIDVWQAGTKEWLSFPNDAVGYALYEEANFRIGPAAILSLQSAYHGGDIDLRLGRAAVDLEGGVFAEFYPLPSIRTRVELLQGISGNPGFVSNFSGDYIWHPAQSWTLALGPRLQVADGQYSSYYFSAQNAQKTGVYVPFHAQGGILSAGAELFGKYDWTKTISGKFFFDYNQLAGDAANNPRVSLRGATEQFIAGFGASYKFSVQP